MDIISRRPGLSVILSFVIGTIFGLVVLGWGPLAVQYEGEVGFQNLSANSQQIVVRNTAELFAFDGDSAKVQRALSGWGGDVVACQMASTTGDPADAARLTAVANIMGKDCSTVTAETPATTTPEEEGGSNLGAILVLFLGFIVLVGAIIILMRRRSDMMADAAEMARYENMPDAPPVTDDEGISATPLARFRTTYVFGHDTYDDSFSIEAANGDFLGECGVGISESIGTDSPKNVTAFEVWLFDKNDIRTVTKVIMSDHAFFDEALKAKLAPKGEPILSRENETIVLETASLIINAEIKEMQYGTGVLPPQSFFERMSIELSTWAKDGEIGEPDIEGRVDEILNY